MGNIFWKIQRRLKRIRQRYIDARQSTYSHSTFQETDRLRGFVEPLLVNFLTDHETQILTLSRFYLEHRFDLLGSGWVHVQPGMQCKGMEGHVYPAMPMTLDSDGNWLHNQVHPLNLPTSKRIWQSLYRLNPTYRPIDWHLDFKSGFRWNPTQSSGYITYGDKPGVDVKVPWELSRMQHLVSLSWAFALAKAQRPGFEDPQHYLREFESQILDFIATNPPRYGVNWYCAMDVAIRVANWLVAYDLLRAYGAAFDTVFESSFLQSVYEHAHHIRNHLEWTPKFRNNHYLADIVGLLYASAYLPTTPESESWFSFAKDELIKETQGQFHAEGSNVEGSTCYHRLSAELCIYGTALALNNETSFPDSHFNLIAAMGRFTEHLTKPDQHVPQFGDNDNGRFLKLLPAYRPSENNVWIEDHLDHGHLLQACAGLLNGDFSEKPSLEEIFVRQLTRRKEALTIKPRSRTEAQGSENKIWESWLVRLSSLSSECKINTIHRVAHADLLTGLQIYGYPQFGVFIFKSERLYLAVLCRPTGCHFDADHRHNDQLTVELQIDGKDVYRDPGTFVYTPLPTLRNRYRSVRAHFAPQGDKEPADLGKRLFSLQDRSQAHSVYWGNRGFIGRHRGFGSWVTRVIALKNNAVEIIDAYDDRQLAQRAMPFNPPPYSPGYGIKLESSS